MSGDASGNKAVAGKEKEKKQMLRYRQPRDNSSRVNGELESEAIDQIRELQSHLGALGLASSSSNGIQTFEPAESPCESRLLHSTR